MFKYHEELVEAVKTFPKDFVEHLIRHGSPMERAAVAVVHPEHLPELVQDPDWWVRWVCSGLPYLDAEEERLLAGDEMKEIRIHLAGTASHDTLDHLAGDTCWQVRRAVAQHAYPGLLERLVADPEPVVRSAAVWNPMCPEVARDRIIATDGDDIVVAAGKRAKARLAEQGRKPPNVQGAP